MREGRIEAHYQPIVHLDTRRIIALEALCRLRMVNGGLLAAASFKEATSDAHIASELTERMLAIVSADVRDWLDMGIPLQHIGINVVAEGIESQAQVDQLARLGCDLGQGYFFSKVLDRAAATSLLLLNTTDETAHPASIRQKRGQ